MKRWQKLRKAVEKPERISGPRWCGKAQFEAGDIEIPDTAIDTPEMPEANKGEEAEAAAESKDQGKRDMQPPNAPKKKAKLQVQADIKGGSKGPDNYVLIDCGGAGNCGWRALSFMIGMRNAKWEKTIEEMRTKAATLAATLMGQAVHHILYADTVWKDNWTHDTATNTTMEDGPAAAAVKDLLDGFVGPGYKV